MLIGLAGGALWALDTVILGMALALPVFTGDPRAAILAPFASTFLHDLCSSLWMLGYTGLRRQYKAVWQALRTRGGRFVVLGALLGGPVGMTGYVLAINALGPVNVGAIEEFQRVNERYTPPLSPHCTRHWARCWHTFS